MIRFVCVVGSCLIALAALSPMAVGLAGIPSCDLTTGPAVDRICDTDGGDFFQVPEPSSLLLVASGLGVLGWVLRRRR